MLISSLYVRQHAQYTQFKNANSWVILSDIEQRIKAKIEAIGTPLKDWDINIYRGILTGYNEAFIIDKAKKEEILANCKTEEERQRTAEIIRPILRGRDIKRYGYEFADLYIITTFPSLKIDIESYPAVKQHLLSFGYDRLKQTGDKGARKKTNNKWFETQDSISYWEDFYKQKIMYSEIVKEPQFYLDNKGEFFAEATTFIMTGSNLDYLYNLLHSKIITYFFKTFYAGGGLGVDGYRYKKAFLERLPIPQIKSKVEFKTNDEIERYISLAYNLTEEEIELITKK